MSTASSDVFNRGVYRAGKPSRMGGALPVSDSLFSAEGRLGVQSFSARYLVCLLGILACLPPIAAASVGFHWHKPSLLAIEVFLVFGALIMVPMYIMVVSAIKRLHDLNHSGWMLNLVFIPLFGIFWAMYCSFQHAKNDSVNKYGITIPTSTFESIVAKYGVVAIVVVTLSIAVSLSLLVYSVLN